MCFLHSEIVKTRFLFSIAISSKRAIELQRDNYCHWLSLTVATPTPFTHDIDGTSGKSNTPEMESNRVRLNRGIN